MGDWTESSTLLCACKWRRRSRPRGVRRKVNEFDLDRWNIILAEIVIGTLKERERQQG